MIELKLKAFMTKLAFNLLKGFMTKLQKVEINENIQQNIHGLNKIKKCQKV
jgi:hypothetical protein